ncbi:MAG: trigger factor, partial [Oscillospiraceae bacterium]
IPGFEPQLVDKAIGEEFEVNVDFPEDYHADELKGKPAIFKCKINSIKAKELPELDDEFAKDVSEFDTLDELKADFKAKTQEQLDKDAETDVENKLIDVIIANMKGDIPPEMIDTRIDEMVRDFEYRLQSQGLNLETYLQYTGMQIESFRKTFEEQSDKQVKVRLALEQVVKMENITIDDATIESEYAKLAEKYKMEVEKVKELIPTSDFVQDLAVNKAVDLVKETAKVTQE